MWDEETKQFAHPTGIIVLTPDGRLARYLFGIEYGPRDLRLALVEASAGKVGNAGRRAAALLLSLRPDDRPLRPRDHARAARSPAPATVLALGSFIVVMVRRERAPESAADAEPPRPRAPREPASPAIALLCGPALRSSPNARRRWPAVSTRCTSSSSASRCSSPLLIAGLIVYFAVKYRRTDPNSIGAAIHGGLLLEITLDGRAVSHHDGDLRVGRAACSSR